MSDAAVRHFQRLKLVCAGVLASVAVYALIVATLPWPVRPALPQGEPLLWGFAFLAAVNLLTIMPVYRVMLAARAGSSRSASSPNACSPPTSWPT